MQPITLRRPGTSQFQYGLFHRPYSYLTIIALVQIVISIVVTLSQSYFTVSGDLFPCIPSTDTINDPCTENLQTIISINYAGAVVSFTGAILLLLRRKQGLYLTAAGLAVWFVLSSYADALHIMLIPLIAVAIGLALGWVKIRSPYKSE
jgi:hypothetical protein